MNPFLMLPGPAPIETRALRPNYIYCSRYQPPMTGGASVGAAIEAGVDLTGVVWAMIGFALGFYYAKK